jgi:hypothetical protein
MLMGAQKNLVRAYSWWLMGRYPPSAVPDDLLSGHLGNRIHVDHCIEGLRLLLMCNADVTPILLVYDDSSPLGVRPEFGTHHRCRNFDNIQQWTLDHSSASFQEKRTEFREKIRDGWRAAR